MHVPWFHAPPPFSFPPWWNGLCPYPMVASRPPEHNSPPLCCLHWPPLSYADAVRCGTANSPSVSHSRDAFWYPTSPVYQRQQPMHACQTHSPAVRNGCDEDGWCSVPTAAVLGRSTTQGPSPGYPVRRHTTSGCLDEADNRGCGPHPRTQLNWIPSTSSRFRRQCILSTKQTPSPTTHQRNNSGIVKVRRGAYRGTGSYGSAEVVFTRGPSKSAKNSPSTPPQHQVSKKGKTKKVPDDRCLPLPEPFDKHAPHPSRNRRHADPFTWKAWKDWLLDTAGRKWRKPAIRKVLKLRDSDPANTSVNFSETQKHWDSTGWVYGLFHFATGRWYVGQTVRKYWVRAQEHWTVRKKLTDVLHQAIANELSPFSFVVFTLEKINPELYQSGNHEAFRAVRYPA